jgi:hypothetical protein
VTVVAVGRDETLKHPKILVVNKKTGLVESVLVKDLQDVDTAVKIAEDRSPNIDEYLDKCLNVCHRVSLVFAIV